MKNYGLLLGLLAALSLPHVALLARGGDAVAGALGGLAIGTMIGTAASNDGRASRAEERAEQVRIDQERQRVAQLEREMDRRDLERKMAESNALHGNNSLFIILVSIVIVLLFGVVALGILVMRKKP
ncbi:hypothetical protein EBZ39_18465 [bacterium]|nr:hypothetical protein [bacterium]